MSAEEFPIEIEWKGKPVLVTGRLRQSRYTYQIIFNLEQGELVIEKDDQGDWRAFAPGIYNGEAPPDPGLVKAILSAIEEALR